MVNIPGPGAVLQPPGPSAPLTLGDLLAIVWRRRIWAGCAMVVVATAVIFGSFRMTPLYEAQSKLDVDRGHQAVDFERDPEDSHIEYSLLNTQRDLLLSNAVLSATLKATDLAQQYAYNSKPDPVEVLRKRLKVTTSRDSWVIEVALRDEDPVRAKVGLQAVLDAFLASQSERYTLRSKDALTFLSESVAGERGKVDEARKRAQEFRTKNNILYSDPDRNQYSDQLAALNLQRVDLDKQLAARRAVKDQIDTASAISDPELRQRHLLQIQEIARHPVVVEQQDEMIELVDRKIALGQKYGDKHPRMIEIGQEMTTKQVELNDAVEMALATIDADYQQLQIQLKALLGRITHVETQLNAYRHDLISLEALDQETVAHEKLFDTLLTRFGEQEVSSRLDTNRVMVSDPPHTAIEPVNIKKALFVAAGIFLGLVAGALTALLIENLDRRVRGPIGVQTVTGLPLLGQLPHVTGLLSLGKGGSPEEPANLAEAYRGVRASLRLAGRNSDGRQVLAITSSSPNEGKSTVTVRLAITLASAGAKVLIIDADMRKPTLHQQLAMNSERGLSFLLAGETGIEPLVTKFPNLDFLPVGIRPPNPAELLHKSALGQFIKLARTKYDFILIDTPPLGLVSDAFSAAECSDQVLLVVRDRHTSKSLLRQVMQRLTPLGDKVIGVVLNGEKRESDGYYYYDYAYKYQYGYGHEPADRVAKPA
jgi:succinoglycan biosynthesis transport protein ExoP